MTADQDELPLLFRFHRGGLDESMATIVEIKSSDDLLKTILLNWDITFIGLQLEPYGYDHRIGWDTYIVRGVLQRDPIICYPVGFLNQRPSWLQHENASSIPE